MKLGPLLLIGGIAFWLFGAKMGLPDNLYLAGIVGLVGGGLIELFSGSGSKSKG